VPSRSGTHLGDSPAYGRVVPEDLIELSGFHAVKHALRFGAADLAAWTDDRARVIGLCERLAPDVTDRLEDMLTEVTSREFAELSDYAHPTRVLGRAARATYGRDDVTVTPGHPLIHLDRPVDPGNVGAAIRVAAAVGAAGVTVTGFTQLWAPACLRGAAGLHYAVPVLEAGLGEVARDRDVVAFDPDGEPFRPTEIGVGSALVFGSERDGVDAEILERADRVVRLPMVDGVSSLNLATAVAAAAYALALV
jgi:TrmH family RNA methyltransferase